MDDWKNEYRSSDTLEKQRLNLKKNNPKIYKNYKSKSFLYLKDILHEHIITVKKPKPTQTLKKISLKNNINNKKETK